MLYLLRIYSLILFFVVLISSISAQHIGGAYTFVVKRGEKVMTDRSPIKTAINGTTRMEISQLGEDISIRLHGLKSHWSTQVMSGRVGNNHVVASFSIADRSVFTIKGKLNGDIIEGEFLYVRYGDNKSGIIPGWTKVQFQARK